MTQLVVKKQFHMKNLDETSLYFWVQLKAGVIIHGMTIIQV